MAVTAFVFDILTRNGPTLGPPEQGASGLAFTLFLRCPQVDAVPDICYTELYRKKEGVLWAGKIALCW